MMGGGQPTQGGTMPQGGGGATPYQQPQQGAYNPFASAFGGSNPFQSAIMALMSGQMQQQMPQYTQQSVAADQAAANQASGAGTGTTAQQYQVPANIQGMLAGIGQPSVTSLNSSQSVPATTAVSNLLGQNGSEGSGGNASGGVGSGEGGGDGSAAGTGENSDNARG
jgi:hypothetical protein